MKDGFFHRENGPAFIDLKGDYEWWVNGVRHRLDGPAVHSSIFGEQWWVDGKVHREDGPAVIRPDGRKEWIVNGKRHRIDGPAIMYPYADVQEELWYIDDRYVTKEVLEWFSECSINPNWKEWTDLEKFLIRLRF